MTTLTWSSVATSDVLHDGVSWTSLDGTPWAGTVLLPALLSAASMTIEAAFGANLAANPDTWGFWDITADWLIDSTRVRITPGRVDEVSLTSPAGCGFQLDNRSKNYSPYHPGSKWWPNVKYNTPIRVRAFVAAVGYVRFQGYANGFTPSWNQMSQEPTITVSASGILRRLNQGRTPLRSALYRSVVASNPIAYWPLEDKSSATQAASGLTGRSAMAVSGTTNFASVATLAGSDTTPDMRNFTLVGRVAGAGSTKWAFEGWVGGNVQGTDTIDGGDVAYLDTTSNNLSRWTIGYSIGNASTNTPSFIHLDVLDNPGNAGSPILSTFPYNVGVPAGGWTHWIVEATQSGADVAVKLYVNDVLVETDTIVSRTLGTPVTYQATNVGLAAQAGLMSVGHFAIYNAYPGPGHYRAGLGYSGETVAARLARLCAEEGITITIVGTSDTAMGAQGVQTLVNLLRECEAADDGVLTDGFGPGLLYVARSARYNRAAAMTLSATADEVGYPFAPVHDDQRIRNLVRVDRENGSSATYEDVTGPLGTAAVGTYDASLTINPFDDSGLYFRAAWEVHKGTVQGLRYPTLALDLADIPQRVPDWLGVGLTKRIDLTNLTTLVPAHPPEAVSQVVEGWTESFDTFHWAATAACSPFEPWRVAVVEATNPEFTWRVDAAGSTLHQSYAAGVTSIQIDAGDGFLWSTSAGDYPRDIDVGGIKVTATAMSGSSSPQTATVTATAYPLTGGSAVKLWRPPVIAL
jgi:hypothetical protein